MEGGRLCCCEWALVNDFEGMVSFTTLIYFMNKSIYLKLISFCPCTFDVKGGGVFTLAKIYELVSKWFMYSLSYLGLLFESLK